MKGISKFDYNWFYGGYDDVAVSKQKYTREQAIEIAKEELSHAKVIMMGVAWVRHGYGVNEDNEPLSGWWLEYNERKNSCPVWCFHSGMKGLDSKGYECVYEKESRVVN